MITTLHALPEVSPDEALAHARTLHAALFLSARGLEADGDLGPMTAATVARLRDAVALSRATGDPLDLPRADLEMCAVCLLGIRDTVEAAHRAGPVTLPEALDLTRLEASLHCVLDVLDAPAVLIVGHRA